MRESLKQPLAVIFEDLHWIDEHTQGLLDLIADSIANARVLLLVNYRPEYRHEWGSKSHYIQIGLKPLGRENAEELLSALLEDALELRPLKQLIIERTGRQSVLYRGDRTVAFRRWDAVAQWHSERDAPALAIAAATNSARYSGRAY